MFTCTQINTKGEWSYMHRELDTVIIGSGPGGYVAAIRAAQLGQKVTLIEKAEIGGTCLNVGCIPSKALLHVAKQLHHAYGDKDLGIKTKEVEFDFAAAQKWKNNRVIKKLRLGITALLKKNQVTIITAKASFMNHTTLKLTTSQGVEEVSFKHCIIATGSSPVMLPLMPSSPHILDSTGLLNSETLPKRLAVIGAGFIGSELAQAFTMMGSQVTLIEGSERILPSFDQDISTLLRQSFEKLGMHVVTSANVVRVEDKLDEVVIHLQGHNDRIVVDKLLVSVGRKANLEDLALENVGVLMTDKGLIAVNEFGQTNIDTIYAIGDVTSGLALAHKASYEAKKVAEAISGIRNTHQVKAIPAVCYTIPEVATTGYTLTEANHAGFAASTSVFPFAANAKSSVIGAREGFVRLVYDEKTNHILGGQIVGEQAGDLIAIVTTAVEKSMTLQDIATLIFPHPSLCEAIVDNAELGLGYPIHL